MTFSFYYYVSFEHVYEWKIKESLIFVLIEDQKHIVISVQPKL